MKEMRNAFKKRGGSLSIKDFDLTNKTMDKCLQDSIAQDKILEQRINAQKAYKIESTPTIIVNEKKYDNKVDYKTFKKVIDKNL